MPSPLDILKVRLAATIMGRPEDCYDPEFARVIALATTMPGGKADVIALYKRLQEKFKRDFQTSRLKAMVADELVRMRIDAAPAPVEGWERDLIRKAGKEDGSPGQIQLCEYNASLYFRNHPAWTGVVGYNEFTASHVVLKPAPKEMLIQPGESIQDYHDTQMLHWFHRETELSWNVDMIRRCSDEYAHRNTFHPVRKMLRELPPWDGVPRLASFLHLYCGVGKESDDSAEAILADRFVAAAGERWAISAVARVMRPGCQADHVLVLEGGEGLGKSTAVRLLAGEKWAGTMSVSLEGKPAQELISAGVWIWELAELASLKRTSQIEQVKDFVTRRKEIFRPAYGHRVMEYERQCVFVATVNGDDYLDRSDGKRRWWPVRCERPFDLKGLEEVVPMLWAEALFKFERGDIWHFDPETDRELIDIAKEEQAARVPEEVLMDTVVTAANLCADNSPGDLFGSTTAADVLTKMNIPFDRRRAMQNEIGRCLHGAGWRAIRVRIDGKQGRRWKRPSKY